MKRIVLFIIICLVAACKKKDNKPFVGNVPASYTYVQLIDSMGITPGTICHLNNNVGVSIDTVIFNADQSITEIVQGVPITYNIGYKSYYFENSIEKLLIVQFYLASDTIANINSAAYENYNFLKYSSDTLFYQNAPTLAKHPGIIPFQAGIVTDTSAAFDFDLYYAQ